MSQEDQRSAAKEGEVCDVVQSRPQNALEGRVEGGGVERRKE